MILFKKRPPGFTLIETIVAGATSVIVLMLSFYLVTNTLSWLRTFSSFSISQQNKTILENYLNRIHARAEAANFFPVGAPDAGFQISRQGAIEIRADLRNDFVPVNGPNPGAMSTVQIICCDTNLEVNGNRSSCQKNPGLSIATTGAAEGECYEGITELRVRQVPNAPRPTWQYFFGTTMSLPRTLGQPRSSGVEFHEAYFSLGYWLNGGQRPRFIIHQIPTFTSLN